MEMEIGEEAEKIPGFLLWQVAKLWQRHLAIALRDLQLSSTQAVILGNIVRLTNERKRATQIMLSEVTKIDPMTASQAIRTLEKKRLIRRLTAEEDKRAYYVLPTEKGESVALESIKRFSEAHKSFFRPFEKDEDIDTFVRFLQKLIESNKIS